MVEYKTKDFLKSLEVIRHVQVDSINDLHVHASELQKYIHYTVMHTYQLKLHMYTLLVPSNCSIELKLMHDCTILYAVGQSESLWLAHKSCFCTIH